MDTRIGYPNEHLAGNSDEETTSPMYATAIGLVLNSIEKIKKRKEEEYKEEKVPEETSASAVEETFDQEIPEAEEEFKKDPEAPEPKPSRKRKNIFEKWFEDFKDFLDNAE
jgi:cell division protein FtsA